MNDVQLARTAHSLDALEEAQRAWRSVFNRKAFEGDLSDRLEAAYDLRDRSLRSAEYKLHGHPQALVVLQNVREGEGHGDLFEDLGVLAQVITQQDPRRPRAAHCGERPVASRRSTGVGGS